MSQSSETKGNYHKINKQMKYEFLNKVLGQGLSIYEVIQFILRQPKR